MTQRTPSPDDADALLARLAELPAIEPDDLRLARVRRAAHAALAEERRLLDRPWLRPVARAWSRAIVPALLAGTVGVYLVWAVRFSAGLYR